MTRAHMPKQKKTAEMDIRVTMRVIKRLRAAGYDAELHDIRDVYGARLAPATAKCGQLWLVVRRVSDVLQPSELAWARLHGAYVQMGSQDIAGLIARLQLISKPHWNT